MPDTVPFGDENVSITGDLDYDNLTGELRFGFSGELEDLGDFTIRDADDGATYMQYPTSSFFLSDEL